MKSLCFATNNKHKIEEMRALIGPFFLLLKLEDIGCLEELPESQPTMEGNAVQKAKYVFDRYHIACFADDSGLEVEALAGEPGVYSARYARMNNARPTNLSGRTVGQSDEDNIQYLLSRLKDADNRKAKFRTVIALAEVGGMTTFEGIVTGVILEEKRGDMGFGYDPVFLPDGMNKTFAEMSLAEKSLISHRARAAEKLVDFLTKKYS